MSTRHSNFVTKSVNGVETALICYCRRPVTQNFGNCIQCTKCLVLYHVRCLESTDIKNNCNQNNWCCEKCKNSTNNQTISESKQRKFKRKTKSILGKLLGIHSSMVASTKRTRAAVTTTMIMTTRTTTRETATITTRTEITRRMMTTTMMTKKMGITKERVKQVTLNCASGRFCQIFVDVVVTVETH